MSRGYSVFGLQVMSAFRRTPHSIATVRSSVLRSDQPVVPNRDDLQALWSARRPDRDDLTDSRFQQRGGERGSPRHAFIARIELVDSDNRHDALVAGFAPDGDGRAEEHPIRGPSRVV